MIEIRNGGNEWSGNGDREWFRSGNMMLVIDV